MPFEPGSPKPPHSGRKKGTPNRQTRLLDEILAAANVEPVKAIMELLPHLEPKQQVDVHLELMGYLYPKRKAVEFNVPAEKPLFAGVVTPELVLRAIEAARRAKDNEVRSEE